jgi:3-oxoacyl-[acyl-carrier-protein] synthase II
MNRRVVITGMGAISSLGCGADALWQSIKQGKSGISRIERIDVSDLPTQVGAEIRDFDPNPFLDRKEVKRMDRFTQYAIAATQMAVEEAKIDFAKENKKRIGVMIGTGIGGIETIESQHSLLLEKGTSRISPFLVPMMLPIWLRDWLRFDTVLRDLQNVLFQPVPLLAMQLVTLIKSFKEMLLM